MLFELAEAKILSEVVTKEAADIAYQPGCHADGLTVTKILGRLDRQGLDAIPIGEAEKLDRLRDIVSRFDDTIEKSPANLKIQDL